MNYVKIEAPDFINGEGVGLTLYVSGCKHHCKGCFNSKLWDKNYGRPFTSKTSVHIKELLDKYPMIDHICILGGDPMNEGNPFELVCMLCYVKAFHPNIKVWVYSGDTYEEIIQNKEKFSLLRQCDILVDGEFVEELKDLTLKFRGSSNQRIIDIQESLKEGKVILYD